MKFYFENLNVWKEGIDLVDIIYTAMKTFPRYEQFGLVSQMRRASVSIPSNIAEGQGRYHSKEFVRFLYTARGSLYEIITQTFIAHRLTYVTDETMDRIINKARSIESKLSGLINSMKCKTKRKNSSIPTTINQVSTTKQSGGE